MSDKKPDIRSYEDTLRELSKTHPTVSAALSKANDNRTAALNGYLSGVRFRGLEELLLHLAGVEKSLAAHSSGGRIAFLLSRASADFNTALEALLSGYVGVAHDAMRDVMEIEFLLRDFAAQPSHIDEWLRASPKQRHDKFRPAILRQRNATRIGKHPEDLAEATDYKAHSMRLHVTPQKTPFSDKGLVASDAPFGVDMCFWEVFEHARRLVLALFHFLSLQEFADALNPEPESLSSFKVAWERTQEMQQIFLALLQQTGRFR